MNGKVLSGILLTFLILAAFSDIGDNSLCEAETNDASLHVANSQAADSSKGNANSPRIKTFPDNSNAAKGNAQREIQIAEHRMTEPELVELKSKIGVCVEGKNYNQLVNRHGTGLRPPTEEEWRKIAENAYIVDHVIFPSSFPSVDQSAKPWFPPIGNQDGEGSCTTWAIGYYVKTFQEAKEHAWDLTGAEWEGGFTGHPTQSYQDRIMSPDFIYHLINDGVDEGSSPLAAIQLVCSIGACSWEKMPNNTTDSTTWPSEEAWTEAPLYRGNSSGYPYVMDVSTNTSLANLKNWIASDNLAVILVDANKYPGPTKADMWTLDNYVNPTVNHANTIVGYDDNVAYTENGATQYGAFKIANSWGVGGWENVSDGFYWISYEAMKQRIEYCMFYNDLLDYQPELAATFRMSHNKRSECNITLGLGNPSSPIVTKTFSPCKFGGSFPFCANNMLFDITEFKNSVPTIYNQKYFLKVGDTDTSTIGTISKFAVEYADSTAAPCQTINGNYVYLNVTLPTLDTTWQDEQLVNSDQDSLDQKIAMATDSGGNMCVAYADRGSLNLTQVFVRKSSDGGITWPLIVSVSDDHNLGYPSIAIDPYYNDIYVAFEREWASNDHDIWVLRFVDGNWSCIPVANTISDDRFPSVTCEYQFGSSNWQYISYEYVTSNDDRDLMFAKSTDHGTTWSVKKLHGDSPDANVYAQTCITNAEGYLYIAFKWGADYNSICEIRVERSIDHGDTWTQFSDVDGLSNDCQFPSIVATHGGDTVMVGFQYKWNASDTDIWYSYSINNGSTWTKGQALFTSRLEDEKSLALVVDGAGTQTLDVRGYIHAVCRVGRYAKYRTTNCSQPTDWNTPVTINDGWVGKGLVITTRQAHDSYCPVAAWTDSRTKNIFSASARVMPRLLALGSVTSWYWQSSTAVNSVAVGDVDDDGQVEAVTGGYYNDGIRDVAQLVVWNSSSLAPEQLTTWYWFGNTTINSVASGDVDGDDGVEIVTGGYYFDGTRQVAQLVVWNGSSLAVEGIRTWYWTNNTVINSVALGDVDGDAQVEIVTGGYYNEGARTVAQLVVWTGSGLSVDRLTTWYWTGNTAINSVAVGDVDADGQVEIVTGGTYFDGTLDVAQLVVWAGSDLAVDRLTTWYWTGDTAINSVAVGDVDGDGQVEIVTGGYHNDGTRDVAQLVIWTGSTLAVDRLTTWYWTGDTVINSVALGDMDGDGQVEIVTSGYYNDGARDVAQMVVWSGSSLVAENIRTWYWVGDTVINAVCLSDTNGDFKAEIITGGYYHDGIRTCAQTTIWQIY